MSVVSCYTKIIYTPSNNVIKENDHTAFKNLWQGKFSLSDGVYHGSGMFNDDESANMKSTSRLPGRHNNNEIKHSSIHKNPSDENLSGVPMYSLAICQRTADRFSLRITEVL